MFPAYFVALLLGVMLCHSADKVKVQPNKGIGEHILLYLLSLKNRIS
jgi:hypothetical protein